MDIKKVQSFMIHVSSDDLIRYVFRDTFANDPTAFRFQQRSRTGEILKEFQVLESTAQLSLDHALKLQNLDKDMISVEIERFSYDSPALKSKFR